MLQAAFAGFTALPAPIVAGMKRPWREVMNFPPQAVVVRDMVNARYRMLASAAHPDKGGDDTTMAELNTARDEALQEVGA